jgi:hypothetical protein
LDASIENSGLSAAYGSMRFCPAFQPAGGVVIPPVHSGIVPSLLAAFSAPTGVSSLPSFAASCSLTAAYALAAASAESASAAATARPIVDRFAFIAFSS